MTKFQKPPNPIPHYKPYSIRQEGAKNPCTLMFTYNIYWRPHKTI
jgi:hypothetical protein